MKLTGDLLIGAAQVPATTWLAVTSPASAR